MAWALHGQFESFVMANGLWSVLAFIPVILMLLTPFVLVIEIGVADLRGFPGSVIHISSWPSPSVGAAGIVASIVIPRIVRR